MMHTLQTAKEIAGKAVKRFAKGTDVLVRDGVLSPYPNVGAGCPASLKNSGDAYFPKYATMLWKNRMFIDSMGRGFPSRFNRSFRAGQS